jgi:hypothetical protein
MKEKCYVHPLNAAKIARCFDKNSQTQLCAKALDGIISVYKSDPFFMCMYYARWRQLRQETV